MNFSEQEINIYSSEHGYFTRLSRKEMSGEWTNAFPYVKFKKGISLESKTKILVKDAWLSFYKYIISKPIIFILIK